MKNRPRDPNQLAKMIVDIATGEVEDTVSESKRNRAAMKGRPGRLIGGSARAAALPARENSAGDSKTARARRKK
jgi:hypothetical protein